MNSGVAIQVPPDAAIKIYPSFASQPTRSWQSWVRTEPTPRRWLAVLSMPFRAIGAVAIERRFAPYDVEYLSHPLHINAQVIKIEESMKHHAMLDAVRALAIDATGNSNDVIRNTADACDTTDIDFGGISVIYGAGDNFNHWVPLIKLPEQGPLAP